MENEDSALMMMDVEVGYTSHVRERGVGLPSVIHCSNINITEGFVLFYDRNRRVEYVIAASAIVTIIRTNLTPLGV